MNVRHKKMIIRIATITISAMIILSISYIALLVAFDVPIQAHRSLEWQIVDFARDDALATVYEALRLEMYGFGDGALGQIGASSRKWDRPDEMLLYKKDLPEIFEGAVILLCVLVDMQSHVIVGVDLYIGYPKAIISVAGDAIGAYPGF